MDNNHAMHIQCKVFREQVGYIVDGYASNVTDTFLFDQGIRRLNRVPGGHASEMHLLHITIIIKLMSQ